MEKRVVFAFLLIINNAHAAETHLLSAGAFDAEEEPVVTTTELDGQVRQRNCISRVCSDHRKCLLLCGCLCGITVGISALVAWNHMEPKCLPIETSLYESCFSVSSNPDQSFCPFPGSARSFLLSDQGRRLVNKKKDQEACVKKISCDGLECSKKSKLD